LYGGKVCVDRKFNIVITQGGSTGKLKPLRPKVVHGPFDLFQRRQAARKMAFDVDEVYRTQNV
jgi:hypothetical protein